MAGKKKKEEGTADPVEEVEIEEQEAPATPDETPAPDETEAPAAPDEGEEDEPGEEDAPADDGDEEPAEEMAEADVNKLLADVRLPDAVKKLLANGFYADEAELFAQVDVMKEAFIASIGAGRPTATSDSTPKPAKTRSELEREVRETQDAINQKHLGSRRDLQKETEQ